MRLTFLIFSLSCHYVFQLVLANDISLTRHADGDVFTIPGSCNEACMVLSSDTASPFGSGNANDSCTCQCNRNLPIFREDLRICVDNIQECDVAGFVSSSGLVEKVPYVFLPQYGQIIYPHAEIKFEDVASPVCAITGVQQLSKSGWTELRNISDVEFPLSLYRDEERTFLRWTGEEKLREIAEGKIVVVKLTCKDSYPTPAYRRVFTRCVAFRVAGSPCKSNIKEVSFASSTPSQGLSSTEYTAIGISSVLLALIYVASVSLYLHSRKGRRKPDEHRESESGQLNCTNDNESSGFVKCNPLLSVSRHFESDTNSAVSEADLADKLLQNESEPEIENITSAIIHPHRDYQDNEPQEQNCNSGSIIAERLPEEDVRVIETTENSSQHNVPVFPGTQRRKLYFNPAYFERQLLLAPPPAAVEFLLKIREVISIAKHKMAAKRFVPTLNEIPEESSSERQSTTAPKVTRKRASSVQNGALGQYTRKSLRCTGCPGCSHGSSTPNLPTARGLADSSVGAISGESRVRAWLEDVKLLDTRWRTLEEERAAAMKAQRQQKPKPKGTKIKEIIRDFDTESARMSSKSLPPLFGEIYSRNLNGGCINEMFEDDECDYRRPRRMARSVTHNPGYFEHQADEVAEWTRRNVRDHEEIPVNANVRRTIEDSFKNQLEQLQNIKSEKKNIMNQDTNNHNKKMIARISPENRQMSNKMNIDTPNNKMSKEIEETRVLLGIINNELSSRSTSDAKRIMDAVIQELVVAKEIDKDTGTKASDYETDSLEKTKISRKSSSSPVSTEKSSPALSTALPMDEELTMRNAIIDVKISETTFTKSNTVVKNHNLPEVVPLRAEDYALVSEVYVNDGYASPTGSDDDSGPEIQYEPENPGHLTIKVVDSPQNYIKQDESEYEPDTLDRKPMKLKITGDINYEKDIVNEVYVDSLERSSQILLKSKKSFREESGTKLTTKPPREYNSLREIYEARLKYQQQQHEQQQIPPVQKIENNQSDTWRSKSCKCKSPLLPRHERRQRKADNQPDVVPKPPPPPPPSEQDAINSLAKNVQDRSLAEAGDPTTCEDAPVTKEIAPVVGNTPAINRISNTTGNWSEGTNVIVDEASNENENFKQEFLNTGNTEGVNTSRSNVEDERRNQKRQQYRRFSKWRGNPDLEFGTNNHDRSRNHKSNRSRSRSRSKSRQCLTESSSTNDPAIAPTIVNLEDSAYVSSPDSAGSRRNLLLQHSSNQRSCSYTESDESTCSGSNGANSESGAESIETDSVFFGNFRPRDNDQKQNFNEKSSNSFEQQQEQQNRPINYQAFQIKSRVY